MKKKEKIRSYRKKNKKVFNFLESKDFLIEIWQLLFFCGLSITLIISYLDQAWTPIKLEQVSIIGISGLNKKDIEKAYMNYFAFFPPSFHNIQATSWTNCLI